jgi:hypothetical protein
MKGKTNVGVVISETETLAAGTEVEIVDVRYGCETYFMCIIPSGVQIPIDARIVDITDHTPYIDWEQRRYELAKAAMQGVLSNPAFCGTYSKREAPIIIALDCADNMIKKLKGE